MDIYNASFSEGGDYECIVKSPVGKIASKTSIIIEGPPGPPGNILVIFLIFSNPNNFIILKLASTINKVFRMYHQVCRRSSEQK